eukprot:510544_1
MSTEEEVNINNKLDDLDEIKLDTDDNENQHSNINTDNIRKTTPSNKFNIQKLMIYSAETIAFLHPIISYSVYLIVPYYVLSTPEKGWTASDLGLFFSAISIGEICGSQIVPLAAFLDSNLALFTGHCIQIIAAFIGYFLMSSIMFFNIYVFAVGMGLLGFSYGLSCVQAYCTEIADGDENLEVDLMAMIGQLYIISNLVAAFALPPIYDSMGYNVYCIVMMLICIIALVAFVILIIGLQAKKKYDNIYGIDDEEEEEEMNEHFSTQSTITSVELDYTSIPILSILSPSMYMLLLLKVVQCFGFQVYCISYPVVFSTDFNISSAVGGFLYAGASMLGFFGLIINSKITQCFSKWGYPYDVIIYFGMLSIACVCYVIIYQPWIGYTFHMLAMSSIFVLSGIEMTSRLFLCPAQAFQQITGIVGVLQAGTYLLGSILTPMFLNINTKFPFLVIGCITFIICISTLIVYLFRQKFLNSRFNDDRSSEIGYLTKERAFYSHIKKSSCRRGAVLSDTQISLLDGIQDKLIELQQQFSSRRGLAFLLNPNASSRLEQFANNVTVNSEINHSLKENPNHNPNALIQFDELQQIKEANDSEDENDKSSKKVSILSSFNNRNTKASRMSVTMKSQMSMRKSIVNVNNKLRNKKGKRRAKMSMARASVFRGCEPAISLNGNNKTAQKEAIRRAKAFTSSRASVFMMR